MKVFLDFEASSLSDRSHPIEVAWAFEDGTEEAHLIAPAPGWDDWDGASEAIHGIARATLVAQGERPEAVAARMIEKLAGHDLFASAPSWDGKWLSALLRAAGLPRHSLRLRDTDEALLETAAEILRPALPPDLLEREVRNLVAETSAMPSASPAHRALEDARQERAKWLRLRTAARDVVDGGGERRGLGERPESDAPPSPDAG